MREESTFNSILVPPVGTLKTVESKQNTRNCLEVQTPFFNLEFKFANNGRFDGHQSKFGYFTTIEHWTGQHTPHLFHLVEGVKRNTNRVVNLIWIGKDILEIRQADLFTSRVLQNDSKSVRTGIRMFDLQIDALGV